MTWMRAIRAYFVPREDSYAGGDLDNAQRLSAVLWTVLVLLTVAILPVRPPMEPTTASGWAIVAILIALGVILAIQAHRRRIASWSRLLATGYAVVAGISLVQWVTGGLGVPYERLLLLPVAFVATTQPPRRMVVFLGAVLIALLLPFIYDGWDAQWAAGSLATFVLWTGLAIGGNLLMRGVRAQRLSHAAEQAEARQEARIDSLTGLPNRRAFDELLLAEMARARRLDLPLSVAMVDIENFKEVNDRWSYSEGDRCLRQAAQALRAGLRQPDFCFRWGGDEFAVILSGTPAADAEPIAARLRVEVAERCKRPDGAPIRVRLAAAELREGMSPGELTEMAGLALTAAKLDPAG